MHGCLTIGSQSFGPQVPMAVISIRNPRSAIKIWRCLSGSDEFVLYIAVRICKTWMTMAEYPATESTFVES